MKIEDMVEEIRADLGADVNSLGISDDTIKLKINESLRKIASYSPYADTESFPVSNGKVELPEDTVSVIRVLNQTTVGSRGDVRLYDNDIDLFSVSRYLYNHNDLSDPYLFLMQKNQLNTLQNFISLRDWRYDPHNNVLYLNNFEGNRVSLVYLRKYRTLEEIFDVDVVQTVKEYSVALCKIIEGQIRRKLQSAPGAIQMDGDALVSEGTAEKQRLDEWIPKRFTNLRFGIRV